ncbi:MAG: hypothetical protein P8Y71_26490, partial [Pseudolabrys sp.]
MTSPKVHPKLRIFIMLLLIVLVYGGVIGFNRFVGAMIQKAMASAPPPVVNVTTAKAKPMTWAEQLRAVGSLKAVQGTMLTAQSAGAVTAIHFHSGDTVKAGTLLVQLNDNMAQAELSADEAKRLNARQELSRQRRLYPRHLTSESKLQAGVEPFGLVGAKLGLRPLVVELYQQRA